MNTPPLPYLMMPSEVLAVFGISRSTLSKWARAGKIAAVLTLGGHRRYVRSEVMALYAQINKGEQQ